MGDIFTEEIGVFFDSLYNPSATFVQYNHRGSCFSPCEDCTGKHRHIYETGTEPKVPAHPRCDCYYTMVETLSAGTLSKREPAADVWLKFYHTLPDYYIEKFDAIKYGWRPGKNTLAGKFPGKMIYEKVYNNDEHILPEKAGRKWYCCDINYESGGRGKERLYFSSDGLIFYSPDHLFDKITVYRIL